MINCSDAFKASLLSPVSEVHVKLELLDKNENLIDVIEKHVNSNSAGDISVDSDRDIRRMFTLTLDNSDGLYTWNENGLIWIDNKRVKLYIGLKGSTGIEYVPQGVFVITAPEATHKPLENTVTISGQDKWYLLTGNFGRLNREITIAKGTNIKTAIQTVASGAGITNMILEDCPINLPYDMTFQIGQNRGEILKQLTEKAYVEGQAFYDIYFDVNGYLRFERHKDPTLESPCWTYKIDTSTLYAGSVRRLDDAELFNHILVLGGSSQVADSRAEIIVDNTKPEWANSPFAYQLIGDRFYCWNNGNPDSNIDSQAQCTARAVYELNKRLAYTERVSIDLAPNYLHEANDVIELIDESNGCVGNYQLKSFTVPIKPKLVTMEAYKIRR